LAIIALESCTLNLYNNMRASFSSTKYCKFFLKDKPCRIKDCKFYHTLVDKEDIIHNVGPLNTVSLFDGLVKVAIEYSVENIEIFEKLGV